MSRSAPSAPLPKPPAARRPTTKAVQSGKNVVMASHGRAPWYDPDGKNVEAYVIGIAGGSASGKTSVARAILSALDYIPTVLILAQDAFYKAHNAEEIELAFKNDLDLDHPDAIDFAMFEKCLRELKQGKATEIPVYSFVHHQRMPETKHLYGASVIIVEGIMALQSPELRDLYDLKVFVNCDSDLMLARRIKRDTKERGRDVDGILDQYLRFVKNSYDNFVQPSSRHADIIVPGSSNHLAIELLVSHVKSQLGSRSLRFRKLLANMGDERIASRQKAQSKDDNLVLLEQTNQLKGIMTILRDAETDRGDFIFYADRLSTLVVEKALGLIPYQDRSITTPLGIDFKGVEAIEKEVVGISILRSGGPFSHGLRRVIRDVPIGAMLIQSDPRTGEPLLLRTDLPPSVRSVSRSKNVRVLLLDSQMGTGAAAMMAIKVLLDHGVPEENIIFLTFLISTRGQYAVHHAFPAVRIVTAAIDPELREMLVPLSAAVMGEAAGEADFGSRVVESLGEIAQLDQTRVGDGTNTDTDVDTDRGVNPASEQESAPGAVGEMLEGGAGDGYHVPPPVPEVDGLRWDRRKRRDTFSGQGQGLEKRAWVVSPGMGHIGDRYYTA